MNALLEYVLEAHGGMQRWQKMHAFAANLSIGGLLWDMKCRSASLAGVQVSASLQEQSVEMDLDAEAKRIHFSSQAVSIETQNGSSLETTANARSSFEGQSLRSSWSDIQVGYFNGYALWQYLTAPFLYAYPGFEVEEVEPWEEDEETWRVLKIVFPAHIAAHSRVQYSYFGHDGLLRRHQYTVDVLGGASGVNYAASYQEINGIMMPTQRRVFSYDSEYQKVPEPLLVSIDISSPRFFEST